MLRSVVYELNVMLIGTILLFILTNVTGAPADCRSRNRAPYDKEIRLKEYPYLALLTKDDDLCGGAIIDDKHIVTSAFCLHRFENTDGLDAHLGMKKLGDSDQIIQVKSMYPHEKFESGETSNDIGLVRLELPITFNDIVKKARISQDCNDIFEKDDELTAIGWRKLKRDSYPVTFQKENVCYVKPEQCRNTYKNKKHVKITPEHICAWNTVKSDKSCKRNGGGPLIFPNRTTGKHEFVGITSYGLDCSQTYPTIYTSVCDHFDWLAKTKSMSYEEEEDEKEEEDDDYDEY
ncbi:chymotrypsin-1-like [Periplaneta americana]|uniref:chymotrypsin-1-like n=1 Tax=Periplaneta americana TaxID=6978 RepID=UPI0037E8B397